jgi:hypothetical protein
MEKKCNAPLLKSYPQLNSGVISSNLSATKAVSADGLIVIGYSLMLAFCGLLFSAGRVERCQDSKTANRKTANIECRMSKAKKTSSFEIPCSMFDIQKPITINE